MRKLVLKVTIILLVICSTFILESCDEKKDRNVTVSYSLVDVNTSETVTEIYVGHHYYLTVIYSIDNTNTDEYSFVSSINANDNLLVTYFSGPSVCNINGNLLELTLGGTSEEIKTVYKIEAKSEGVSFLKFKDLNNVSFSSLEVKFIAKEEN